MSKSPLNNKQKKLTKKKKASLLRSYKRKQWQIICKEVRARDNNKCQVCGKIGKLDVHHILDRKNYKDYWLTLSNLILLCPGCHKYSALSAHRNPIWWSYWLERNKPVQNQWVKDILKINWCSCFEDKDYELPELKPEPGDNDFVDPNYIEDNN